MLGKVKPNLPDTIQELNRLSKPEVLEILNYYNIPVGRPDSKNKEEIAKFIGIPTSKPITRLV